MAIQFIVDSASDILPTEAKELGLKHIPLKTIFGEREYLDAIDLTHQEFYEKLIECDIHPTTSQPSPLDFIKVCDEVVKNGDTGIIFTVTGKLSGTYQSAMLAAREYDGKIVVVDTESVSLGERILILRGLGLADEGLSIHEIKEQLDKEKKQIKVLALLDTLEYLKRGGRISKSTAAVGNLLSIKPVLAVKDGELILVGKARGSKQANNLLRKLIKESKGIDFKRPICLAYSGLSDAMLQKYIKDSADIWEDELEYLPIATVGCVVGTHAGPGAIAVAFFEKE